MRDVVLLTLAIGAAACGGSPASPNPDRYTLTAGSYTLSILPGTAQGTPSFCFYSGPGAGDRIAIPVTVGREGSRWAVRPASGSLTMMLGDVADGYEGSLAGSFTSGGSTVTVGSPEAAATVAAPALGASHLTGPIQGDVRYSSGTLESWCNVNVWSLIPR